jgi:hypothetical protein
MWVFFRWTRPCTRLRRMTCLDVPSSRRARRLSAAEAGDCRDQGIVTIPLTPPTVVQRISCPTVVGPTDPMPAPHATCGAPPPFHRLMDHGESVHSLFRTVHAALWWRGCTMHPHGSIVGADGAAPGGRCFPPYTPLGWPCTGMLAPPSVNASRRIVARAPGRRAETFDVERSMRLP